MVRHGFLHSIVSTLKPMVRIVVAASSTASSNFHLFSIAIFPAASSPTINIVVSVLPTKLSYIRSVTCFRSSRPQSRSRCAASAPAATAPAAAAALPQLLHYCSLPTSSVHHSHQNITALMRDYDTPLGGLPHPLKISVWKTRDRFVAPSEVDPPRLAR